MKNDIVTKSTDFLPGKPSLDTVSKTNVAQPKAVQSDDDVVNALAPRSAHVIDLKNTDSKPSESPLLQQAEAETPTPLPVTQAKQPAKVAVSKAPVQPEEKTPEPVKENKTVGELNLAQDMSQEPVQQQKPKKTSKLKWFFGILAIILAGAVVAAAVLYVLTQYLP